MINRSRFSWLRVFGSGVILAGLLFAGNLILPRSVQAGCTYRDENTRTFSGPFNDTCHDTAGGGSSGTAYFSCDNYCADGAPPNCVRWAYGCYYHTYTCDTTCQGAPTGVCTGPNGGPCSGDCGSQSCRAATAGNGGACGCHPSAGGLCHPEYSCNLDHAHGGSGCSGGGQSSTGSGNCGGCNSRQTCCKRQSCCYPTAPGAATLNAPVSGYQSPTTDLTLSWSAPASWGEDCVTNANNSYTLFMGTTSPPYGTYGVFPASQHSYQFVGGVPGTTYYWRIQTSNANGPETTSPTWHFKIVAGIPGTVYYDPNNVCSKATPWNKGAGLTVKLNGTTYSSPVASGGATPGQYNIPAPGASYPKMTLSGIPVGYGCSTVCGQCPTKTNVQSPNPPAQDDNYFLSDTNSAWWQVVGGSVYAGSTDGGTTIQSQLTNLSTRLIKPDSSGNVNTEGVAVRASGNISVNGGKISDSGASAISTFKGKTANYEYFAANMGVVKGQASDFISDQLSLPSYDATKDFYYDKPVSGAATLSGPWHVLSGQKYVIFVNGDFNPNYDITVDQGGFLAVIVSGDINIGASRSNIDGLYVADGNFTTLTNYVLNVTNDVPLHVNGSVVAWGNVSLHRDLGGVVDDQLPAETFTYRPDLLLNMPNKMKTFVMQWQEVPAGSFGN